MPKQGQNKDCYGQLHSEPRIDGGLREEPWAINGQSSAIKIRINRGGVARDTIP
jgi:hypothetical protein